MVVVVVGGGGWWRGRACFPFCTIKVNVISNQKFVLGMTFFNTLPKIF